MPVKLEWSILSVPVLIRIAAPFVLPMNKPWTLLPLKVVLEIVWTEAAVLLM